MDDTAKTISELLLERLKESAALEAAGEAVLPFGTPVELPVAAAPPELQKGAEAQPDRNGARRAYAQAEERERGEKAPYLSTSG